MAASRKIPISFLDQAMRNADAVDVLKETLGHDQTSVLFISTMRAITEDRLKDPAAARKVPGSEEMYEIYYDPNIFKHNPDDYIELETTAIAKIIREKPDIALKEKDYNPALIKKFAEAADDLAGRRSKKKTKQKTAMARIITRVDEANYGKYNVKQRLAFEFPKKEQEKEFNRVAPVAQPVFA